MSAELLNSANNACIECVAGVVCLTMHWPLEDVFLDTTSLNITACRQSWCPQCYRPHVIQTLRPSILEKTLDWTLAPLARKSPGVLCDDCLEVHRAEEQVYSYVEALNQQSLKSEANGYWVTGLSDSTATGTGVSCFIRGIQWPTAQPVFLAKNTDATQSHKLEKLWRQAVDIKRMLQRAQKARARDNIKKFWSGRKP